MQGALRQGQVCDSHHWLQQSHVVRQEATCGPASPSGLAAAGCAAPKLGAAKLEDTCRNAAACSAGGPAMLREACTHCCRTFHDYTANLEHKCLLHRSLPSISRGTMKSNNTAATAARPMSLATHTTSHWAHQQQVTSNLRPQRPPCQRHLPPTPLAHRCTAVPPLEAGPHQVQAVGSLQLSQLLQAVRLILHGQGLRCEVAACTGSGKRASPSCRAAVLWGSCVQGCMAARQLAQGWAGAAGGAPCLAPGSNIDRSRTAAVGSRGGCMHAAGDHSGGHNQDTSVP